MNWPDYGGAGRFIGDRIDLRQVSLCAVTSVNVLATVRAMEVCLDQAEFASCLLLTNEEVVPARSEIRVVPIKGIHSSKAYSKFIINDLADYVDSQFCMIVQWDSQILNSTAWMPQFLEYDYVGASWPQFDDGQDVGNGGFSLRSRRLMCAYRNAQFAAYHPEDVAICRVNRPMLEAIGMRFAPKELADRFSAERAGDPRTAFGFHGVWHLPAAVGADAFWDLYCGLDDRSSIWVDLGAVLRSLSRGHCPIRRMARTILDCAIFMLSRPWIGAFCGAAVRSLVRRTRLLGKV